MSSCPQCGEAIEPSPHKRPRTYCGPPCQTRAANARRQPTREGRKAGRRGLEAPYTPKSVLESPKSPSTISTPQRASNAVDRLAELMDKAHSRVGVTAWEIAEIARARKISPWAPLAKIIAR